ncbi:MAG: DsbA family protein [Gammaproteobacteria bacterium]|nr:DsbA family protein [Gammaproteobacteria bacterium]MDH3412976.1 DsbA family protein [Gammaproteobacteria bacterium]
MRKLLVKWPLAVVAAITLAGCAPLANADMTDAETEALKARIKQEILEELLQGGQLDPAIDAGITRYVEKQRQARAEAEAREQQDTAALAKNVREVSAARDHIYGNPEAIVSLIEYSDFECPFCKQFHLTAKEIVDAYDGKVNWVYRHFPLAFHNPGAQLQAEASECAAALGGNEAFWKYTDTIYERTTSNGDGFPADGLVPLAREVGIDGDAFRQCLTERRYTDRVKEDFEEGVSVGIRGTPGNILLNNETGSVIPRPGAAPLDIWKQLIDGLLEDDASS